MLGECYQSDTSNNKATIAAVQGKISRATARLDNLIAMRADGEISKEKFGELRQKAENELATLNEELDKLNAVSDELAESLDMNAIKSALDEMIDFLDLQSTKTSLKSLFLELLRLITDTTAGI